MRRHRGAAAAAAVVLRPEPRVEVRLVPEYVAADAALVARRGRLRERRVLRRLGLVAPVAPARVRARPHRSRARQREHGLHARAEDPIDRAVDLGPVVAPRRVVGGLEVGRALGAQGLGGDARPVGQDAHALDAELGPARDGAVGVAAAVEQDPVIGDGQLGGGGLGRRGAAEQREQDEEEREQGSGHQGKGTPARGASSGHERSSPSSRTARKASCGISTRPTCFMRFLPSFWRSSSLRLRVISPP